MTEATQIDPNRDLIWFTMGEALRGQAKSKEKTDRAGSKEAYGKAAEAYQKAIAIKPQGAYYNNLADAYAHSGDVDGAVKAYNEAATLDPPAQRDTSSTSAPYTPTPVAWMRPLKPSKPPSRPIH